MQQDEALKAGDHHVLLLLLLLLLLYISGWP
jgi:hypothetical protein